MSSLWKEVAIGILKIKPMTPDWPEKLELRDLPKLQFQQLGEDWIRDKPNHKAFDLMLRIAITDPPDLDCETKSTEPITGVFKDRQGSTLVHDVRFLIQYIRANDFAAWLIRKQITPSKYIQNWFEVVGVKNNDKATPATVTTSASQEVKPVLRSAAQDEAILSEIRRQGHDPLKLPKNEAGKPGVAAAVRGALVGVNPLFPKIGTQFKHAWERLRAKKEIRDKA